MRAALLLAVALGLGACGQASSSGTASNPTTTAEPPPSHAEQASALAAKRALRALVVRSAQGCSDALVGVNASSAASAARTCAALQLAEDPFAPEAAPSTAREVQRQLRLLAEAGPGVRAAEARLAALPAQLAFAVTRVILSPPEAARRAQGVLERALRVTLPRANGGDAMAAAELEGAVGVARAALAAITPLAQLAAAGPAEALARAEGALPPGIPPASARWPDYGHAVAALAGVAGTLATELHAFRQGGAYV